MKDVIVGMRIGSFIVVKLVDKDHYGNRYLCKCDCGKEFYRIAAKIEGKSGSCGCKRKHGDAPRSGGKGPYSTWKSMLTRCYNPNYREYHYYGGKGVKVCTEWHSYSNFKDWMYAHGWEKGLTIDRIDSRLDYTPSNCQILTAGDNARKAVIVREGNRTLDRAKPGELEYLFKEAEDGQRNRCSGCSCDHPETTED